MTTAAPNPIERVDRPLADLEQEIRELRAHAEQHLAERGESPSSRHLSDWHEFLDIDPDLRGRDYSKQDETKGAS